MVGGWGGRASNLAASGNGHGYGKRLRAWLIKVPLPPLPLPLPRHYNLTLCGGRRFIALWQILFLLLLRIMSLVRYITLFFFIA